ncbi:MAG TPA: caspase family protein [Chitinophagaceae bacterium]|nr:caspase family protein [Chitinophagaceae bacterium]
MSVVGVPTMFALLIFATKRAILQLIHRDMEIPQATRRLAVIIAIEEYRNEPQIPNVRFARNDANAFKQTLIDHFGYKEEDIIYWIEKDAVQNTLLNDLPYTIQQLSDEYQFIFYYAGHGFFQNGNNRLTCWDSHHFNLSETTVSLKEILFDPLEKSGCQQSLIFLDCCSTMLTESLNNRDIISDMTDKEFAAFVRTGKYDAVYLSCSPGEKSSSSGIINHGIWTYHLVRALSGLDEKSIVKEKYITSNSLQNYLSVAIPKFIREQKDKYAKQTPFARISAANEFLIRELPEDEVDVSLPDIHLQFENMYLRKISESKVKDAKGFVAGYKPPKFISRTTQQFVQKVFFEEIQGEIGEIVEQTKDIFKLRDGDISYDCQDEGGHVETEYFKYYIRAGQHERNPSLAVITREIYPLIPLKDLPADFDSIFPIGIDELIIPIIGKVNFDDLAGKFENLRESEGGDLSANRMTGSIEYISSRKTSLTIDTGKGELIITRYALMGAMELIQSSIEDIRQLSQQNPKYLNGV